MKNAGTNLVIALIALIVWVVVVFGASPESGLAHVPLALAVVFLARAIVLAKNKAPTPH